MSTLRFRFSFNQRSKKLDYGPGGTRGAENFSRVLVRDVAFTYSERMWELLKSQVSSRMHADIDRELDHMAKMFMLGVVGIAGRNRGPSGQLTTVAPQSEGMAGVRPFSHIPVRSLTGDWTRRSPFYLRDRGGDQAWFRRHGGVLDKLSSAKTWTNAFGGVTVSMNKHTSMDANDPAAKAHTPMRGTYAGQELFGVATIRVDAMRHITPAMLPAVGGGGMGQFGSNPRGSGLLALLGERAAWRLGGNPVTVPFRPTIQPFLGYFLTRQMPNAVMKRIEQGLASSRWQHETANSAGRTR